MNKIITDSALTGGATLASAMLLQQLYKTTNFYPPKPVFWFFIGFNAQLAVSIYKRYSTPAPVAAGLAGFGESIASIDSKVRTYQANISGLQKILRVGSPKGKVAARKKLSVAQSNLARLFRMRDQAK